MQLLLSKQSILCDEAYYGHDEAFELFARLERELGPELGLTPEATVVSESYYVRARGSQGTVLSDSFHLGQTFANDYGRPLQSGLNFLAGASGYSSAGRFNLYVRGEYQEAPSGVGYSPTTAQVLTSLDELSPGPHSIVPAGEIARTDQFRLLNASLSIHLAGSQLSFGRIDRWLGPARGGSMAWSNNAEPIYAFAIDRVEPMYVPLLSRVTGPFRYEFLVGSLKGHDTPNDPWVHLEKVSFKPHADLEFGFSRTVIWGGKGHAPITVGSFLRSFVSTAGVDAATKFSRDDPGARFSTFDFEYRMPWRDHLLAVYADSFVHDDVFPVSAPHRAAVRTGVLLSRLPHLAQVDLRLEGAYSDVNDPRERSRQLPVL